jgi:hypothetical protein
VKEWTSKMLTRVANFRTQLDYIVDDEEEMALMALSRLSSNPNLYRYAMTQIHEFDQRVYVLIAIPCA